MKRYIKSSMTLVDIKQYDTPFGTFSMRKFKGKVRSRDYMGRPNGWRETTSIGGHFDDYPSAIEFFLYNDYGNRYVSSSQGDNSREWVNSLGAANYDEAIKIVMDAVVDCFRDYYNDDSIN